MNKNLTITSAKAKSLYESLDATGKSKLEQIFGKKALGIVPVKILKTDIIPLSNITSYADVCKIKKIHATKSLPYPKPKNEQQEYINQVFIVDNIIEVINQGKPVLSFSNKNQLKWRPWFDWDEVRACFVFVRSNDYFALASAGCGPRLCFHDEKTSDYFAKTFLAEMDKLLRFTHRK